MKQHEFISKRAAGIIWNAKICCICKEKFGNKNYCKVRDHYHYTGEYIEVLCIANVIWNIMCLKRFL